MTYWEMSLYLFLEGYDVEYKNDWQFNRLKVEKYILEEGYGWHPKRKLWILQPYHKAI